MIDISISKKYKTLLSDKDSFYSEVDRLNKVHEKYNLPDYYNLGNLTLDSDFSAVGKSDQFFTTKHLPWTRTLDDKEKDIELKMLSYEKGTDQWLEIKNKLNLKSFTLVKNTQLPNEVTSIHIDLSSGFTFDKVDKEFVDFTTSDLKKYIIFLKDWVLGQIFMFPKSNITKWKKFDVISFPWYMYHATANTSHQNKELLLVTGV